MNTRATASLLEFGYLRIYFKGNAEKGRYIRFCKLFAFLGCPFI